MRRAINLTFFCIVLLAGITPLAAQENSVDTAIETPSIAREWNEALLSAIRLDTARPTVHARNLFHTSAAMWDAWAAYQPQAKQLYQQESSEQTSNLEQYQAASISHAVYDFLDWRFKRSLNYDQIKAGLDQTLARLRERYSFNDANARDAIGLGRRIAKTYIELGLQDGSNEVNDYASKNYQPLNDGMNPYDRGNVELKDADRWQALVLPNFVGQSGIQSDTGYPPFVGPEWGDVQPFSLTEDDAVQYERGGRPYKVYFDQGPPPMLKGDAAHHAEYIDGFMQVLRLSGELGAIQSRIINTSPAVRGNNSLGKNDGMGRSLNPVTQQPYDDTLNQSSDYYRTLAEYWADGPNSETPPGHWFVLFNLLSDQPSIKSGLNERGIESQLQWDLQGYLALGGAMHDAAIAAWSHKGWYDYIRPISAIRNLCGMGQSSDKTLPNYNAQGIKLEAGLVELITEETTQSGARHQHLKGKQREHIGGIAVRTWRGPSYIENRRVDVAGVGWIHCGDWWPYQRPTFVTPPFAGYVSGHSTFSRAAAEVLTLLTGTPYFPGGLAIIPILKYKFLVFEKGPSQDVKFHWATFQDAADDCSLSRIYGGIHPPADDLPGRIIGYKVGHRAYEKAAQYFPD